MPPASNALKRLLTLARRPRRIALLLGSVAWAYWWIAPHASLVVWATSLLLFGYWLFEPLPSRSPGIGVALFALMLAAALIPRVVCLESAPYCVYEDEAHFPYLGSGVLHEHITELASGVSPYFRATYFSLALQAWPGLFLQPLLGARVASAIFALGSLLGVYLLAARLFDRTVGVIAFMVLASSYWHIAYSRMGYPYMQPICLVPWALYIVLLGATAPNRFLQFLGGIALGASLLVYTPARIVLPIAVAWFAYRVAVGEARVTDAALGLAVTALGGALILSPYFRAQGASEIFYRFHQATLENQGPLRLLGQCGWASAAGLKLLLAQLRTAAQVYVMPGGLFAVEHGPHHALVDLVSLVLAAIGLIAVAAKIRDSRRFLLVVWVAATFIVGQVLTDVPTSAYRAAPLLPALAICAGIGGRTVATAARRLRPARSLPVYAVGIALGAVILPLNLAYLLDYLEQRKGDYIWPAMARLLGKADPAPTYYLVAPEALAFSSLMHAFAGRRTFRDASNLADSLRDPSNRSRGATFVLHPTMAAGVELIRRCHPGAVILSETSEYTREPVLAVAVSPAAFAADTPCGEEPDGRGLLASYFGGKSWDGPVVRRQVEDWPYHYERETPTLGSVEWRGYLRAPVGGSYRFRLLTREGAIGDAAIGRRIKVGTEHDVSEHLEAGEYPILIRCRPELPRSLCWLEWVPPGGPRTLIPPQFLRPPDPAATRSETAGRGSRDRKSRPNHLGGRSQR